jgi:hypothetical protein
VGEDQVTTGVVVDSSPVDPRIQKHIAYWITLPDVHKEQMRREWSWLARMYDDLVVKYVDSAVTREYYKGLAARLQVADHFSACGGHSLPEMPSLSKPSQSSKSQLYHLKKSLHG